MKESTITNILDDKHLSESEKLIAIRKVISEPAPFDLSLESHAREINQIIGATETLMENGAFSEEDKWAAQVLVYNAWSLKEKIQGKIDDLVVAFDKDTDAISFKIITGEIHTRLREEFPKVDFNISLELSYWSGAFLGNRIHISNLLELLLTTAILHKKRKEPLDITISIQNWEIKGIAIVVDFNGTGIPISEEDSDDNPFFMINQLVDLMKGELEILHRKNVGSTITTRLSHYSPSNTAQEDHQTE